MSHPLHPALVHFPVAAWTLATLVDIGGLVWSDPLLWQCGGLLMGVGCAAGLLAAGAGFLELIKLPPAHPAGRDAMLHMTLALLTWCLYAGSLLLRSDGMQLLPAGPWARLLSGAGLVTLLATGWVGGKLVYGHGVGVSGRD